jgi:exopolyphosphatase/pppGpp-phosphohydrolase
VPGHARRRRRHRNQLDPAADRRVAGASTQLERRSIIASVRASTAARASRRAIARVTATLGEHRTKIAALEASARSASDQRRATPQRPAFVARVRDEYGIDAHVLTGDEEANLTFAGALAAANRPRPLSR